MLINVYRLESGGESVGGESVKKGARLFLKDAGEDAIRNVQSS